MGSGTYERKITDEFFNSPIGRVVKDAIYNGMTIICNPGDFITCGEYDSNNITIVYEPVINMPIVRTGDIWYHDTLLIGNVPEDDNPPVHIHTSYNTGNGKCIVYAVDRLPFYLVWTTTIKVKNESVNTYTRKIKVIPKDISKE